MPLRRGYGSPFRHRELRNKLPSDRMTTRACGGAQVRRIAQQGESARSDVLRGSSHTIGPILAAKFAHLFGYCVSNDCTLQLRTFCSRGGAASSCLGFRSKLRFFSWRAPGWSLDLDIPNARPLPFGMMRISEFARTFHGLVPSTYRHNSLFFLSVTTDSKRVRPPFPVPVASPTVSC